MPPRRRPRQPFIRRRGASLGVAVLVAVAAGAAPALQKTQSKLSTRVTLGGGHFSTGDGLTVAMEFQQVSGRLAVCGTWAKSRVHSSYTVHSAGPLIARASVYLDGRRLVHNLRFMPETEPRLDYAGAPAGCAVTDRRWQQGDAARVPVLRIPRQVIETGRGGARSNRGGVGPRITFRQDGPGAIDRSLDVRGFLRRNWRAAWLSATPARASGRYQTGGRVIVEAELQNRNGRTDLCGHWAEAGRQSPLTRNRAWDVLRLAEARDAAGRVLLRGLHRLNRVAAGPGMTGRTAACVDLERPWRPEIAEAGLQLHLPATVVYRNTTAEGQRVIRFAPVSP